MTDFIRDSRPSSISSQSSTYSTISRPSIEDDQSTLNMYMNTVLKDMSHFLPLLERGQFVSVCESFLNFKYSKQRVRQSEESARMKKQNELSEILSLYDTNLENQNKYSELKNIAKYVNKQSFFRVLKIACELAVSNIFLIEKLSIIPLPCELSSIEFNMSYLDSVKKCRELNQKTELVNLSIRQKANELLEDPFIPLIIDGIRDDMNPTHAYSLYKGVLQQLYNITKHIFDAYVMNTESNREYRKYFGLTTYVDIQEGGKRKRKTVTITKPRKATMKKTVKKNKMKRV